jgi:hypothetical protein
MLQTRYSAPSLLPDTPSLVDCADPLWRVDYLLNQ